MVYLSSGVFYLTRLENGGEVVERSPPHHHADELKAHLYLQLIVAIRHLLKYSMIFRPCPNYPGYSVTLDGVVKRDKPRADGSDYIVASLFHQGRLRVALRAKSHPLDRVVADAWGDEAPPVTSKVYRDRDKFVDRPASSYQDGRVLHISEFIALRRAALDNLAVTSESTDIGGMS